MGKRGLERRLPGEEPYLPALMRRRYGIQPSNFRLDDIDVAALRKRLGLSQPDFAHRFGFPVATLRHWEQGARRPQGCALALLHVIDFNPGVATRAILRAKRARQDPGTE
jgi:DNA-binding transcriptional regulator YiaG